MSEQSTDVFPWLKSLPVAPEFRPTLTEFQDPIAYIFKIEEEASRYGICKILPPLPPPSKKTTVSNLNRSLAASASRDGGGACDYDGSPAFATRQQQVGFCPRKQRPVQRPVWQSGERYSFGEFEAKAKTFEKSYLKKCCGGKSQQQLSALEIETLYWRATVDKPFSVEYANDMPGSAFIPLSLAAARRREYGGDGGTVGETAWNMRAMARAEGSLLKFMKEEIPGVTSPMVYVAMMFSWFAWHVEDHDLHSLNYLHMGAGKTWYGVPKDAAVAFEEVVRDHGYGGELNPLVTFSTLGEKTTVMSPEVFVKAGIPCCRLVQNPGEFVVTFPRAYHSGFSHESMGKRDVGSLYSAPVRTTDHSIMTGDQRTSTASVTKAHKEDGALGLLASVYGDSSDSEEEDHKGLDTVISQNGASPCEASVFGTNGNEEATDGQRLSCGKGKGVAEGSNGGSTSVLEITPPFVSSSDDDSSRLYVFCLEHAAEVEQQLRPFGGINIMLLCHPEYPRIEAEGKIVAGELGVNHEWNDTEFRNVTREDEETIQAALVNVEAKAGNSDWTVKLGINLSYSAILSRSPLYSKQMPYNSVIYNMFGRSSPPTSSPTTQPQVSGKRSSRQRKYVVGKWCGKVWMSHQVHPFLLQEDLEGEESERSHLQIEDVSGERLLPCSVSRDATTMFERKYSRKRKMRAKAVPRKKLTSFKREDGVSDDTSEDHSYKQQWRGFGNEEEMSDDDSSNPISDHQQLKGLRRDKGVREFESDDEVSDRSLGEEYAVRECADSDSSMDRDALEDSVNGHNDDNIYRHPRSRRAKVIRIPVLYDSDEIGVYQQRGYIQASRVGGDCDSADDSLEEQEVFSTRKRQTRSTAKLKVKTEIVESPRDARDRTLQQSGYRKKNQDLDPYMEGPNTRLRVRNLKPSRVSSETKPKKSGKKGSSNASFSRVVSEEELEEDEEENEEEEEERAAAAYECDIEGCTMSFSSEKQLSMHRRNICPVKGCGKNFFSHKYLVQHRRVHSDDRALKCPWKGCKMTFKWAWSRTEHIRVHTGARPYHCAEPGCGQTFRFVSDFSRHKKKTGHSVKKTKKR